MTGRTSSCKDLERWRGEWETGVHLLSIDAEHHITRLCRPPSTTPWLSLNQTTCQCSSSLVAHLHISCTTYDFSNFYLPLCQKANADSSIFINSWYAKSSQSSKGLPVVLIYMRVYIPSALPTTAPSVSSMTHWTWFKSQRRHYQWVCVQASPFMPRIQWR